MLRILCVVLIAAIAPILASSRPDSRPFISGDSFRSISDHIYDETTLYLEPSSVRPGDIIFINLSHVESFFLNIHPKIQAPYILISHNHDYSAPGKYRHMLDDDKLIAWFTQNADLSEHPKLIPIPIGLSNKHWEHSRKHDLMIQQAQATLPKKIEKKHLFYVNFNVHTAPSVRQPVYDFFIRLPFCSWFSNRPYKQYLNDLAVSKVVLSPHGNGLDCHRTWEALYMGSYPLVKASTLDPLYQDLPVIIVNDWSDVTPEFLEKKYQEMQARTHVYDKLYFDYWYQMIIEVQKQFKSQ